MHARPLPAPRALPLVISFLLLVVLGTGCATRENVEQPDFPRLTGPYLGQTPPGADPEPFARGVVCTGLSTRDMAMTPDGREMYWTVMVGGFTYCAIVGSREVDGVWTRPEVVSFARDPATREYEPCISPDGQRFFFVSDRADSKSGRAAGNEDIWVAERVDTGWSEPVNLGTPVNSEQGEYFPSVTRDGTLYFTRQDQRTGVARIMCARWTGREYSEPEALPDAVNSGRTRYNAFVAPDESYLILTILGRDDTIGGADYYVCFRGADDAWSAPVDLGPRINTEGSREHAPYISPDGRYFFFMSSRTLPPQDRGEPLTWEGLLRLHGEAGNGASGVWWCEASFLQALRPQS